MLRLLCTVGRFLAAVVVGRHGADRGHPLVGTVSGDFVGKDDDGQQSLPLGPYRSCSAPILVSRRPAFGKLGVPSSASRCAARI